MLEPPDPKLAATYDAGGKFDQSFNQSAFQGAARFKKETGISFIEAPASSDMSASAGNLAIGVRFMKSG